VTPRALDAVPWKASGTPFQLKVWETLCTIPAGETLSYAGLAERIGRPSAVRAVGLANGANPVAVVVPCHRVIGTKRLAHGLRRRPAPQGVAAGP
jgi:methylated-DNA-[protein]-cysteine S-methyltransferase